MNADVTAIRYHVRMMEHIPYAFVPFYFSKSTTFERSKSSDQRLHLGLAIAMEIIEESVVLHNRSGVISGIRKMQILKAISIRSNLFSVNIEKCLIKITSMKKNKSSEVTKTMHLTCHARLFFFFFENPT